MILGDCYVGRFFCFLLRISTAWPTAGYDSFILFILVYMLAVYVLYIDVSMQGFIRASMFSFRYEMHVVNAMLIVYSWIRLTENVLIYTTLATSITKR